MPSIYDPIRVAAKIAEGVEAIGSHNYPGESVNHIHEEIASELRKTPELKMERFSKRAIQSWKYPTTIPREIEDGKFFGFIYLALKTERLDLAWLVALLEGTSTPFTQPMSPQLLRAYLGQARLQGNSLNDDQITQIIEIFFDERIRHPISVLWDSETTECIERKASIIFVVTPDFRWEYDDPEWAKIIHKNIVVRGVKYYQLYKDTPENQERLTEIKRDLDNSPIGGAWKNRIHHIGVSENEFIWYKEHVFYDPFELYGNRGFAIVISGIYERFSNWDFFDMNLVLTRDEARFFRKQFIELWNRRVEDKDWRLMDMPSEPGASEPNNINTKSDDCLKYWRIIPVPR